MSTLHGDLTRCGRAIDVLCGRVQQHAVNAFCKVFGHKIGRVRLIGVTMVQIRCSTCGQLALYNLDRSDEH